MKWTIELAKFVRAVATIALGVTLGGCVAQQTATLPGSAESKGDAAEPAQTSGGPIAAPATAKAAAIAVHQDARLPVESSPGAGGSTPFSTRYAHFQPAGWEELPGWLDDNVGEAWLAFRQSCAALSKKTAWSEPCSRSGKVNEKSNESIRQFFQREFTLYEIHNADRTPQGVITGYYEALLSGSRSRGGAYIYPVYATPHDLLTLDVRRVPGDRRGEPFSARLDGRNVVPVPDGSGPYMLELGSTQPDVRDKKLRVRLDGNRIVPYFTRAQIEQLGLPKARVLVWVDNPAALYSMQIQGSGKVRLPGGEVMRLAYAEQNGHPFQPPVSKSGGAKTRLTTRGLNIELPGDEESDPFNESEDAIPGPTMRSIKVGDPDRPRAAPAAGPSARGGERNRERLSSEVEALVEQLAQASPTQGSAASTKPRPASPEVVRPPRVVNTAGGSGSEEAKPLPAGMAKATPAVVAAQPLPIPAPGASLMAAISGDPSYVFFREIPDSADGPLGALGVPLTAGRSVAVDPRTTPLGFPLFLATTEPGGKGRLNRLVMAQDTGGAIRGAVRADYFWGFGAAAYAQASRMKETGRMWLLLPRGQQIAARDSAVRMRGIGVPTSTVECVVADPDLCVEDR